MFEGFKLYVVDFCRNQLQYIICQKKFVQLVLYLRFDAISGNVLIPSIVVCVRVMLKCELLKFGYNAIILSVFAKTFYLVHL